MRIDQPYHEGELRVQERAGELTRGKRNGAVVSDTIPRGAIPFLAKQPMIVVGSLDDCGRVWASILFGLPGFVSAPHESAVVFDLHGAAREPKDPVWSNLETDARVGLLAIDLGSRRRLRVNGRVASFEPHRMRIDVEEAYPICPKYIQRRHLAAQWSDARSTSSRTSTGTSVGDEPRDLLEKADTLFVASAHPDRGVDASHRGGDPGFVRVLDGSRLRIPDYPGNSMFNTLGNFVEHPHAALAVPDFEGGRCLQVVGRPEVRWDLEDRANQTGGTRRFWDLHVDAWICTDLPAALQWEFLESSPHNPQPTETGRTTGVRT